MKQIRDKLQKKAEKLIFEKEAHNYSLPNKGLISVSALVDLYKKPFDPDGSTTTDCASRYCCVCEEISKSRSGVCKEGHVIVGISPRMMADIWKANNKIATDKGTETHQIAQDLLEGTYTYPQDGNTDLNALLKVLQPLCEELKPYLISCEQIIFNETLGVAGTPDVLTLYQGKTDLWDFKTDKNPIVIDYNPYNNYFLPPIQDLPSTSYYYYALKMSVYRYILELEGYKVNTLGLLHIKKTKIDEIILPYLKFEVELMLEDHKKKQEVLSNVKNT
jgi:hypothetical protein